MAIELITGHAGVPHVDSEDVGAFQAAMFGKGVYILNGVECQIVDTNTVLVTAGELLCEGRHIRITGSETLTIDNGQSGYNRRDIIGIEYNKGNDIERVSLRVEKGVPVNSPPSDPYLPYENNKLLDGATQVFWKLFAVERHGINMAEPEVLIPRQGIYQLGTGITIPEGADLNDYTKVGVYDTYSSDRNKTLINFPPDHQGSLDSECRFIVEEPYRGYIEQTVTSIYSGCSWHRVKSGYTGSWTAWRCSSGIDTIVAEGTSGSWSWRKYANGMAECFAYIEPTWSSATNYGSLKYSTASPTATMYPFAFVEVLYRNVRLSDNSWWMVSSGGSKDRINHAYAYTSTQTNVLPSSGCYLYTIGRWK